MIYWPFYSRKIEMAPHIRSDHCMGTEVYQKIYGIHGAATAKKLMVELHRLDALWSPYQSDNIVNTIRQSAGRRRVQVDSSTLQVLLAAKRLGLLSQGAFDCTVYPLLEIWRKAAQKRTPPTAEKIEKCLPLVNIKDLQVNSNGQAYLPFQGQGLDLGGIGKGYAADRAREIYEEAGIHHAVISIGGNVLVMNCKPDGSLWKIGIKSPFSKQGPPLGFVEAENCSVVTAGDYEQYFTYQDPMLVRRTYHHIIDPRTGWPAESNITGVTIMSTSSIEADALATAVFILGVEKGFDLCSSFHNTHALIVDKQGSLHLSEGMELYFSSMVNE